MPDPLDTAAAKFAYGMTRGALAAWSLYGPEIVSATVQAWKRAWQTTMTDADQAPSDLVTDLQKEVANATK